MNDSFQSMKNDQSLKDENFDQKNRNVKKNQEKVISSAKSLQSVKNNQKTTYQVDNQIASTHAAETEINPADENAKHFVLVSEPENQPEAIVSEMINQAESVVKNQADNRLISEEHNSLILNYSRSKIRHDYKQLHRRDFVKSAKFESGHELITSKTFEQIINGPQAKK